MKITLYPTNKYPYGAYKTDKGIRISTEIRAGKQSGIILYPESQASPIKIDFPDWSYSGRTCAVEISLESEDSHLDPYACKDGRGIRYLLYSGEEVYLDPYMHDADGYNGFGFTSSPYSRVDVLNDSTSKIQRHKYKDMAGSVYYMLHVRGYTAHKSAKVKCPGTFMGLSSKLGYIKELGVTSIILMPAYEFNEIMYSSDMVSAEPNEKNGVNFWGYTDGYFYKPKHAFSYTGDPVAEYEKLISDIHDKDMEVIMQFCFPASYSNRQITDVLRFWHDRYNVDGFQLVGSEYALNDICLDPELYNCKILSDVSLNRSDELYNMRHISTDMSYMIDMRSFLKGDPNSAFQAALRLKTAEPNINVLGYIARQDTMRAIDIVSYNEKHNESNGENGRDGADFNYSWNCGFEGPTRKKNVVALRNRQITNALALTLLGQSAPLIYGGDEFGNTQYGNNNPYNQDNDTGYIKWPTSLANKDILEFTRKCLEIRSSHPILGCNMKLTGRDYLSLGYPDVSLHGEELWRADLGPTSHSFGILYYDKYADAEDDRLLYLIYNMHWEPQKIAIPNLKNDAKWNVILTNDPDNKLDETKVITVAPRSFIIVEGK